jgi:hypothetical protein
MDKDGKQLDMTNFGCVFIKYSSAGGQISECGDAMLNGYQGSYRGVYFNPVLADGEFRQYAVLPLQLFESRDSSPGPSSAATLPTQAPAQAMPAPAPAQAAKGGWTKTRVEEMIAPLMGTLSQLGASLQVLAVDHSSAAVPPPNTRLIIRCCSYSPTLAFGIRVRLFVL